MGTGYLSTRVKGLDEDDWKNLKRMIQYVRATKSINLTLESDISRVVKWLVDAAYAVHNNMKSHGGGAMTFWKDMAHSSSTKQKLNTRSSREARLVSTNYFMPQLLRTKYFLQVQGFEVKGNILYQDNLSTVVFEKNCKGSSFKCTRHINIRFLSSQTGLQQANSKWDTAQQETSCHIYKDTSNHDKWRYFYKATSGDTVQEVSQCSPKYSWMNPGYKSWWSHRSVLRLINVDLVGSWCQSHGLRRPLTRSLMIYFTHHPFDGLFHPPPILKWRTFLKSVDTPSSTVPIFLSFWWNCLAIQSPVKLSSQKLLV